MKKILAVLLIAAMVSGIMSGCGAGNSGKSGGSATEVTDDYDLVEINGYQYKKYKDMTGDKITLTYFNFDQNEITQYLAKRFMEIYPNITVNTVYENVATYDDTLLTLVSNGDTPDVIMYSDADFALSNMLLTDISSYWDTDPETKKLASTVNDAGMGTFSTKARYAAPVKFFPGVMYVDRKVLETLNVKAPTQNWTWNEMIQLIKDATVLDSPDGMAYYGLGYYNRLDSYYGIAASQDIIGEFGFDGIDFDLSAWAVGEQEFSNLQLSGYVAPQTETQEMEDWYGDWEGWCGASGHVAMFSEAFWTFQGTWNTAAYKEAYDLDIVPYVVPAVSEADASADHHSIATIDFGGVTSGSKYPREAYELLKFMSYGIDGWMTRIEAYNDESIVNSSGLALKYDVMPAPITADEAVWSAYINMYCAGMDDEHVKHWETYFKSCMQPICFGWENIAGYWNFCDEYFNDIGIHDLVDKGKAQAADYVDEGTRKANYYHAQAMLDYFGASGYNVLSGEETALYEKMAADNQ
ncbi:MAG: ABC transporter substrate-binding protein [Oscillospiraceae bacterium]|jgi:multiple sugar transport system substrate-binding protein|nr:ABC transporter substrate-binding protein [Oscillospiraceae bacterium]